MNFLVKIDLFYDILQKLNKLRSSRVIYALILRLFAYLCGEKYECLKVERF